MTKFISSDTKKCKKKFEFYFLGPIPLPFIGNVLTIKRLEPGEDCFLQWEKQYGGVYSKKNFLNKIFFNVVFFIATII